MALEIRGRDIENIAIVDDQPDSREGYGYTIQNVELIPLPQPGPLGDSLAEFIMSPSVQLADAALSDFNLSERAYATFSGAQLVAQWYKADLPALLCTRFEKISSPEIAPYRRWIPVLLNPNEVNEESLIKGIDECIYELSGNFRVSRRPWRTQVHFIGPENEYGDTFFAEVPAWGMNEIVKIRLNDMPKEIRPRVAQDFRCYAHVNLGAESFEELYWYDWEMP